MVMHYRRLAAPTSQFCFRQRFLPHVLLIVSVAMFLVTDLRAQSDIPEIESQSTESGTSLVLDDLDYLRQHPLDIFRARLGDLTALPGINTRLIHSIRSALRQRKVQKLDDLCRLLQLSDEQTYSVTTFMRLSPQTDSHDSDVVSLRVRVSQGLERQRGYSDSSFAGGPLDCTERLNIRLQRLECNILLSKDAGEQSYADFYSGYLQWEPTSQTRVIVGDFSIDAGLGSIYSRSLSAAKSSSSVSPLLRLGSGLHAYHSSMEYHFFRGAAVQTSVNFDSTELRCFGFASSLQRSASIDPQRGVVSSLDLSGLHRTESELSRRRCLTEQSIGAGLECRSGTLVAGVNILGLRYDHLFENITSLFATPALHVFSSAFASITDDRLSLNTECAVDATKRFHVALSLVVEDESASVAFRLRHSDANFTSPFGASLAEFSQLSNEEGIFCGIMIHPISWLRIQGYVDVFRSLIPRYGMSAPTRGTDFLCEAYIQVQSATMVRLRMHNDVQSDAVHAADGTLISTERVKNSARVESLHDVSEALRFRIRLDAVSLRNELMPAPEYGACISTSCDWRVLPGWRCGGSYALYSSDSFATALYAYETSAPGAVTSTALYGDGARVAFYAQHVFSESVQLWLRYDIKVQNGTNSYGSSTTEISGQQQSHALLQLDCRW